MDRRSLDLMTTYVAALGALLAAGAWLALGTTIGVGALVGAGVGVANWLALRWILGRVMRSGAKSKGALLALLVVKMLALVAVLGVLVVRAGLSPIGLTIGVSALVVGLFAGSLHARSLPEAAGEER